MDITAGGCRFRQFLLAVAGATLQVSNKGRRRASVESGADHISDTDPKLRQLKPRGSAYGPIEHAGE